MYNLTKTGTLNILNPFNHDKGPEFLEACKDLKFVDRPETEEIDQPKEKSPVIKVANPKVKASKKQTEAATVIIQNTFDEKEPIEETKVEMYDKPSTIKDLSTFLVTFNDRIEKSIQN